MALPISDSLGKLTWADNRLVELSDRLLVLDRANPNPVEQHFTPDGRHVIYKCANLPPIPAEVPLMVGEILYGYRSALDCAVFALAGKPTADSRIEFPIFLYERDDAARPSGHRLGFDRTGLLKIRHLPDAAIEVVRNHQPFAYNSHPSQSALWALHELRNIDGHRSILMAAAAVDMKFMVGRGEALDWEPFYKIASAFKPGDVVLDIANRPTAEYEVKFATEVMLTEPGAWQYQRLRYLLTSIRDKVGAAVRDMQRFS
jgi:hypothetical protein